MVRMRAAHTCRSATSAVWLLRCQSYLDKQIYQACPQTLYICICSSCVWLNPLITRALRGRSVRNEIYGGREGHSRHIAATLPTYRCEARAIVIEIRRLWTKQYRVPLHSVTANAANLRTSESLSPIKIIAQVISCMDHQKVVGQMPYLPTVSAGPGLVPSESTA